MTLTLQHPKVLRTAFLCDTKLNDLKSHVNLSSVCHCISHDDEEFKKLPNIKVVYEFGE